MVGGALFWGLGAGVKSLLGRADLSASSQALASKGLTTLTVPAIALGVTWVYLRLADGGQLSGLGLSLERWCVLGLPAGIVVAAAALTIVFVVSVLRGGAAVRGLVCPDFWALLAAVGIATQAGWVEELVCRGVLLQRLERGLSRPAAVVLSTFVFVLFHLVSSFPNSAVRWLYLTLVSLTFTAAYYIAGRNLWLPIGLHWGTDLWVLVGFGFPSLRSSVLDWRRIGPWTIAGASYVDWLLLAALPITWLVLVAWRVLRRRAVSE